MQIYAAYELNGINHVTKSAYTEDNKANNA